MKKISFFLFAAFIAFTLQAHAFEHCGDAVPYENFEQHYTRGLLFKVEKCGAPVSYVFGTVHLSDKKIEKAAKDAFAILPSIDSAGFELVEPQEQIAAIGHDFMVYRSSESHSLILLLGHKRYAMLLSLFKKTSITPRALENFRPWAIAVLLELLGEERGLPLDEKLRASALKLKKHIFGLETLSEQAHLFADMPKAIQKSMLVEAIDHHAEANDLKHKMLSAYVVEDLKAIEALEQESIAGDDTEANNYMVARIINDRNRIMEKRMLPYLRKESILISVGAMHLMGDQGILHLLEQDGYRVTPLPSGV